MRIPEFIPNFGIFFLFRRGMTGRSDPMKKSFLPYEDAIENCKIYLTKCYAEIIIYTMNNKAGCYSKYQKTKCSAIRLRGEKGVYHEHL